MSNVERQLPFLIMQIHISVMGTDVNLHNYPCYKLVVLLRKSSQFNVILL